MLLVHVDAHLLQLIKSTLRELTPVGLIAQMMEHCNGIAEVRVQVSFRPEHSLWSSLIISKIVSNNCDDHVTLA